MSKEGFLITDLHTHNLFSPDSCATPEAVVKRCLVKGIACLAVTNHNTISGAQETVEAAQKLGVNLTVITGEEITTGETNSVGKKIEILAYFLEEAIPSNLSTRETLIKIRGQGALAGIPHPFELWRHGVGNEEIIHLGKELGIPLLWEAFNSRSSSANNQKAEDFLKTQNDLYRASLLTIAGSDAHHSGEIGRSQLLWLKPWDTKEQFLVSLQRASRSVVRYHGDDSAKITLYYRVLNRINILRRHLVSRQAVGSTT